MRIFLLIGFWLDNIFTVRTFKLTVSSARLQLASLLGGLENIFTYKTLTQEYLYWEDLREYIHIQDFDTRISLLLILRLGGFLYLAHYISS